VSLRVNLRRYRAGILEPARIAHHAGRYLQAAASVTGTSDSDIPEGQLFGPPRMLAPPLATLSGAVHVAAGAVDDTPRGFRLVPERHREVEAAEVVLEILAKELVVPTAADLDVWATHVPLTEVLRVLEGVR
jgi:hypothetical protein